MYWRAAMNVSSRPTSPTYVPRCATKRGAEPGIPREWQKSEDLRPAFLQAVEDLSVEAFADVAHWHETDMPMRSPHVGCWGINGPGWGRGSKSDPDRVHQCVRSDHAIKSTS